jgi:transposase
MEGETDWSQISRSDQRSYIKIETLRGLNPTEIHNALREVCGYSVLDLSMVSQWASRFREGWVSIQDDPRSGRPVAATDDTSVVIVSTLLEEDGRKSCEEIARETNMSTASVFRIVTHTLQNRKAAAKWFPRQLSEEQKAARKRVADEPLRRYEAEGGQFLNRNVAADETWIQDFEPELTCQSPQCNFSPEKCRRQQSKVKLVMIMAYGKDSNRQSASGVHCNSGILQKVSARSFASKDSPTKSPPCSQPPVSSFCTITRGLMPQVQYRKFWKSMDSKCFPTRHTVLT